MKKNILFIIFGTLLLLISSCDIADGVGNDADNAIYLSNPNETGGFSVIASDESGATFSVVPRLATIGKEQITVTLAVDKNVLDEYNKKNNLSLKSIDPEDVVFKTADGKESRTQIEVTINKGELESAVEGRIESLDPEKYPYDEKFAVPVKVTNVSGSLKLLSDPNSVIVSLDRKIKTSVLHMINPNGDGYTLHFTPKTPYTEEHTEWTLQFMAQFNSVTGNNQTSASLEGATGFYNRISPTNGFQIKSEGRDGEDTWTGTFTSKGVPEREWLNVSYVYRRSGLVGLLSVYINGEFQHTFTTSLLYLDSSDGHWGFGNTNLRDYYLREFRYWNRALSEAEILDKLYLPEDPAADGLEAYFPLNAETFDEENGVFEDLTGNWEFIRRNNAQIEIINNVVFPSTSLTIENGEE